MGAGQSRGAKMGVKFGSYFHLLGHPVWSRHAWLGLILCCAGIIGLWGLGNFHPTIVGSIIEAHLSGQSVAPGAGRQKGILDLRSACSCKTSAVSWA